MSRESGKREGRRQCAGTLGDPCLLRSNGRVIKKEPRRDSQRSRRKTGVLKLGKQDFKELHIGKTNKMN